MEELLDDMERRQPRLKLEAMERLSAINLERYHLDDVDERLERYVRAVIEDGDGHCIWEVLSVERFLTMVDRYGINRGAVRRFVCFYESLFFPGVAGPTRYKLTPVQYFEFCNIFGFWSGGRRVVREVCLFVPRKFSKTTSTASLAVWDLLFGDANGEAYVGANSNDQAKKCFDVIRGAVRALDPGGRRYVVNKEVIMSRRADRTALAQCLTSNARTKDGLSASVVIMDEFSQARDNELLTVLTTSMGIRRNPLTVIITTASDVMTGPFYGMLAGYKSLLAGDFEDDSVFAHLFEPDVGDDEADERTWRKVQPHLGVTVSLDFYRREFQSAQRNGAEAMLAFRTKLLNRYSDGALAEWISGEAIEGAMRDVSLENLVGRPDAMVGIDLSESDDLTAVTFGIYDRPSKSFYFVTDYFFPEGALAKSQNGKVFRAWAEAGYLHLTPGPVIAYSTIVEHIVRMSRYVTVRGIGFDAWKSVTVINMLRASGFGAVLRSVKQTYGTFSAPVESFEHAIKTSGMYVNKNPINRYCFQNAVLDVDKLGNMKPLKRRRNDKIDGVITTLMSLRLFMDAKR
jgi:phage terminase large subunit-like protein